MKSILLTLAAAASIALAWTASATDHEGTLPARGEIKNGQWRAPDNLMAPAILRDSLYAVQTGYAIPYGYHFHKVVLTRRKGVVVAQRCLADTLWPPYHYTDDPDYRMFARGNGIVSNHRLVYEFVSGVFYDQADRLRVTQLKIKDFVRANRRAKSTTHFFLGSDNNPHVEDFEFVSADSILGYIQPRDESVPWRYVVNDGFPNAPKYRPDIEELVIGRQIAPHGVAGREVNLLTGQPRTVETQATRVRPVSSE